LRPAQLSQGWWHFFGLLEPDRLDGEIDAARRQLDETSDPTALRRLTALVQARNEMRAGSQEVDPPREA
jgi:hypothetical protein